MPPLRLPCLRRHLPWLLLAGLLAVQGMVGSALLGVQADRGTLAPPPDDTVTQLMAAGDRQMLFRALAQHLFVVGDLGGRVTPLRELDYDRVTAWLDHTAPLDPVSQLPLALALLYYAQSPDPAQIAVMVQWARGAVAENPHARWRWLTHAAVAARHRAHDLPLALAVANDMAEIGRRNPALPIWTRQMPAFVLDAMGEVEAANALMGALLAQPEGLDEGEILYMRRYLEGEFRTIGPRLRPQD